MLKTKVLKTVFASSALLLFVALLVSIWPSSAGAMVVVETELPNVPDEMYALKPVLKEITEEQALGIASIFGVSGEIRLVDNTWRVGEVPREVWVYKSGCIKYFDTPKVWGTRYLPHELPSSTECISIAEQFLENLGARGLVSKSLQISFAGVVSDITTIAYRDGRSENYLNNTHVNFALSYDNIPLEGPGAKVRVYIGKDGEITGFIGDLWEVETRGKVRILSPKQAIEKLGEVGHIGIIGAYGDMPKDMVDKITIKSVRLVYFVPPVEAESIIPSYRIEGTFLVEDGSVTDFGRIIPAQIE